MHDALNFWQSLPRPIIGLAPMDGVSDHPFRHIQKKYGKPDIVYTEFTSVEALCHGDWQSMNNLIYDGSQRPILAQIYGRTPAYFRQVAILLCELGFDGIDINMGCPAKSVANGGCGAGMIRTPDKAQAVLRATQEGVRDWQNGATLADCSDMPIAFINHTAACHAHLPAAYQQRRPIPVSVKTRIGYHTPVVQEWIPTLLEAEPAAICLHGRTLQQRYSGLADWTEIARAAELAKGSKTLILGNGDVASRADALQRVACYGVDGVLIGRATMGNPYLFQEDGGEGDLPGRLVEQTTSVDEPFPEGAVGMAETERPSLIEIALEHAYLYEETYRSLPRYYFLPMRKHMAWYIRDLRGAGHLRASLVQTNNAQEAEQVLREHRFLSKGVYRGLFDESF